MEGLQDKRKKGNVLKKTWERCKSIGHGQVLVRVPSTSLLSISSSPDRSRPMVKSKSCSTLCLSSPLSPRLDKLSGSNNRNPRVSPLSPKGCLSVYVGPDKQRFVIKISCTNHPLFKVLLEQAESEYGFHDGPIMLPCEVDLFVKVLYEMEANDLEDNTNSTRCKFPRSRSSYHLLTTSSRLIA
ncbi:auxin-responsive protein SAUR72-like [Chenopodium quinoa]|uniref:auxin-responsive protein SAUR72-like n=1 Tax=Chenopodium quinoa TaxID=63459 RepID=UPI000B772E0E|nr:auxin-responsive protein SAUR72-like [Chenopodium quinoa]